MEIPYKKFPKIDLARLSSFQEILENAVPFATGNFLKSNQGRFPNDQRFRFAFLEICSGEWNNSRFPRYPVPQFLGLSYLLGSQVLGFQLLGSQFLSSWARGSLGIR